MTKGLAAARVGPASAMRSTNVLTAYVLQARRARARDRVRVGVGRRTMLDLAEGYELLLVLCERLRPRLDLLLELGAIDAERRELLRRAPLGALDRRAPLAWRGERR